MRLRVFCDRVNKNQTHHLYHLIPLHLEKTWMTSDPPFQVADGIPLGDQVGCTFCLHILALISFGGVGSHQFQPMTSSPPDLVPAIFCSRSLNGWHLFSTWAADIPRGGHGHDEDRSWYFVSPGLSSYQNDPTKSAILIFAVIKNGCMTSTPHFFSCLPHLGVVIVVDLSGLFRKSSTCPIEWQLN